MTVFVGNTNLLEMFGLRNNQDDGYINNATLSVTVKDKNGNEAELPDGFSWPLEMTYVNSSNGDYYVTLPVLDCLSPGRLYTAYITIEHEGMVGYWEAQFYPEKRIVATT